MNALIWKKYKWITQNMKNMLYFFAVPIAVLLLLNSSSNKNALLCYFPFISVTFGILFDQMDIENIVQKEYAMYTPMSLKESWIYGAVTSWLFRFIYSVIVLILGLVVYRSFYGGWYANFEFFIKGIINGISALGVVIFASQYEMDFAIWKQWLSFMWISAALIGALILDEKTSSLIPTSFESCVYLLNFSGLLVCFALWQSKKVTTENFIVSLEGVRKIADARYNVVDD